MYSIKFDYEIDGSPVEVTAKTRYIGTDDFDMKNDIHFIKRDKDGNPIIEFYGDLSLKIRDVSGNKFIIKDSTILVELEELACEKLLEEKYYSELNWG